MDASKLFGLAGRNVLITGAFSGMGKAAAKLLYELDANVYAVCRKGGRHSNLDFPVKGILYADFASRADIEQLASDAPEDICALFLCHGIAQKPDGSNLLDVQKVNFLGHKHFLNLVVDKICDNGSVSIISSAGGFGWEANFEDCKALIESESYEDALKWYDANLLRVANPDMGGLGYTFSKQCLDVYVKLMVHDPMFIDRKIRINVLNPGNAETGLTEDFNLMSSSTGEDPEEGRAIIEAMFQESWNGRWATAEEMGYPLVAIGSKLFSYMSGQIIYLDYGMSSVWEADSL